MLDFRPVSEVRTFLTASGREVFVLDGQVGFDLDALIAACNSKACAPPPVGRGGSLPSGSGSALPNGADPEPHAQALIKRWREWDILDAGILDGEEAWDTMIPKDPVVRMRIGVNELNSILHDDGVFKSQHETGSSRGYFGPEKRERRETQMFSAANTRPKYGYLSERDQRSKNARSLSFYGDIAVEFKDEVAKRTTFTVGDSLNEELAAMRVEDIPSASPERRAVTANSLGSYVEAQIHGTLTLNDVVRIYVTKRDYYDVDYDSRSLKDEPSPVIRMLAQKYPDIEIVITGDDLTVPFSVCDAHNEFACKSRACAPPPVGTGGSLPSGSSGFQTSSGANPESHVAYRLSFLKPDGILVKGGFVDKTDEEWKKVMPKNPVVRTRAPESVLRSIAESGEFKTQHETKTSSGYLDPDFRKHVERRMFGDGLKTFPFYGYLAEKGGESAFGQKSSAYGYGNIVFEFKPSVNRRTTVTLGDSMTGEPAPLPVNDVLSVSKERRYVAAGSGYGYVEAQVHDKLTVQDVERIYVNGMGKTAVKRGTMIPLEEGYEGDDYEWVSTAQAVRSLFPDIEVVEVSVDDFVNFSACTEHGEFACTSRACAPPPVGRGGSLPSTTGRPVYESKGWESRAHRLVRAMSDSIGIGDVMKGSELAGDRTEEVIELQTAWGSDSNRISAKIRSNMMIRERLLDDPEFIDGVGKLLDTVEVDIIDISTRSMDAMYDPRVAILNLLSRHIGIGHVFPLSQQFNEIVDDLGITAPDPSLRDIIEFFQESSSDYTEDGSARIGDLTPEQFAGYAVVAAMIDSWADTSMGTPLSIAHQLAASKLHGVDAEKFISEYRDPSNENQLIDGDILREGRHFFSENQGLLVSMARAEYEATQQFFAQRGIKEITVYRGIKLVDPIESNGELADVGDTVLTTSNVLSSWSIDPSMGKQFAEDLGAKLGFTNKAQTHGYVIAMTVPVKMVQAIPTSGRGCLNEYEAIVIGHPSEVGIVEYLPKVETLVSSGFGVFLAVR
jgi:hypothetical protein